ncbi:hypothetical protein D3C85_1003470 [compost metagenome]
MVREAVTQVIVVDPAGWRAHPMQQPHRVAPGLGLQHVPFLAIGGTVEFQPRQVTHFAEHATSGRLCATHLAQALATTAVAVQFEVIRTLLAHHRGDLIQLVTRIPLHELAAQQVSLVAIAIKLAGEVRRRIAVVVNHAAVAVTGHGPATGERLRAQVT